MNWMHAFFGLGVALGPLIMTAVIGVGLAWRWGYGLVAAAQLLLALAFALTVRAWRDRAAVDGAVEVGGPPVPVRETLRPPAVWLRRAGLRHPRRHRGRCRALGVPAHRGAGAERDGRRPLRLGTGGSLFVGRVAVGGRRAAGQWPGALGSPVGWPPVPYSSLPGPVDRGGRPGGDRSPPRPSSAAHLTTVERVGDAHADRTIGLQIGAAGLGGALARRHRGAARRTSVEALGPALAVLASGCSPCAANRRPVPPAG
jgi:hypothetical protein